jgi:uncharacterized cupredoxin-like copper-binding protein
LLTVAAGCSGCAEKRSDGGLPVVRVSEQDFKIKAPRRIRAGEVRFRLRNRGPDTHELIVVRLGRRGLPLRRDGLTVDEDALEARTAVTIEAVERGRSREKQVALAPGRYVLFCNMAGHYLGGMRATLVVE